MAEIIKLLHHVKKKKNDLKSIPICLQDQHSCATGFPRGCSGTRGQWKVLIAVRYAWRNREKMWHCWCQGTKFNFVCFIHLLVWSKRYLLATCSLPFLLGLCGLCAPAGLDPECHSSRQHHLWPWKTQDVVPESARGLCTASWPGHFACWRYNRNWREGADWVEVLNGL